jgi:hypothetical protein
MQTYFDQLASENGFDGFSARRNSGTCRFKPAYYEYTIGRSGTGGAVFCQSKQEADSGMYIYWTDERLDILSYAFRTDLNLPALYKWWLSDSGPVE